MTQPDRPEVVIVGAGPAGMFLAYRYPVTLPAD